jgi:hypothetical protein
MAVVECRNRVESVALGQRDDRGIRHPEREVEVLHHQLFDALPVGVEDRFHRQLACDQSASEGELGVRAYAIAEEVGDLDQDERRDQQRAYGAREELNALRMMGVAPRRGSV